MQPNTQPQPYNAADIQKQNKKKTTWGIICLVGPTALLVVTILLYAVVGSFVGSDSNITNILLYLVGIIVILTWLPGIIIGIVLLSSRKKI